MSSSQVLLQGSRDPAIARRVSGPSGQADAEALAILKRTLFIAALETPPRFRSDIDVVMIQQHLASLGVFASVAPQILQYLATECTINRIPDGEVLFYQEDAVDDHSHAYIILEGSLCGYFNKAFSRRHSRSDNFRSWNSKKANAKGVNIDFGDLQVTYSKGAICGIDDFYSSTLAASTRENRHHLKSLCRHRSVHSQESTTIIVLAKDTLDRVSERFGFVYEKGILTSSKETARTDVSHLALFSLLSDTSRRALLQTATTRQLTMGEVLFPADDKNNSVTTGFAIVRNGWLDVRCVDLDDTHTPGSVNTSHSNASTPTSNAASNTQGSAADPLVSLSRGQTFGDQMVALGHPHVWATNPHRRHATSVRFQVVAGDSSTEVLWITRDQYDQFVREDQLRLSYSPIFGVMYAAYSTTASLLSAIETRDSTELTRKLLTDATLSKFFFQFPPLVLERLCHHMEIQYHQSDGELVEAGGAIEHVYIVVTGALHSHYFQGSENDRGAAKKMLGHQGSARRIALGQDVHFIPGDAFGARELMKHSSVCEAPVLADAGTTLLCIARSTFERWVSPMRHNTIIKAGSILQPFVWSNSSPPASPRHAYTSNYSSLVKINRRQSGPSVLSSAAVEPGRGKARRLDEAAILLKRLRLFQTLPRFLLAQMLSHVTLLSKAAGDELFCEGDAHRALVVILSGFVSFYSLENMAATIDMFQKHPFCNYSAFSGSTVNPEDYVAEPRVDENAGLLPPAALKHRAAMHGVHIQTLPYHNAFRTGVLQEGTVCPATVLAQTDCEYLLFDENMYTTLLAEHTPAVNMSGYNLPSTSSESTIGPSSSALPFDVAPSPKLTTTTSDHRSGTIPPALLSHLETTRIPWLPPSSAKKTLLLRSMIHMHLAPGQRLIQHNETLTQIVLVVSGKLAVYVRENQDGTSVLNASQRSVQSAALERSVASNYSTTSQQLYQERSGTTSTVTRRALQRKIARISEVDMPDEHSKPRFASPNTHFTNFVMHAAREAKARQLDKTEISQIVPHASKTSPSTRRSLHSMVSKVKFQHKRSDLSSSASMGLKDSTKALFMFHLDPGDIYGDEITAPSGIYRSVHDIYADTTIPGSPGAKEAGPNRSPASLAGTEVLCLDRHVLHSILAKTEEDVAKELIGRSSNAKTKWQLASKKLFKRASHSTFEEPGEFIGRKKTPKLFDFFKNILNQRRFLMMGTISHFPLLRDLTDDARRELCLNARFEALDRYTDAYKGNGDENGTGHRFFLLLTGRINLVANGPSGQIISQSANSPASDHSIRDVCAGESFGEFEILSPEAPAYIAAIAAESTKLLSIPAEMFMRHWPCTNEARGNIEYLRTQIPSFMMLDLERIAYLYHSFSFQTHVRGTNIFQFHDTKRTSAATKEVYLIKEGTCCIRQYVTLASRTDTDSRYDPCDDDRPVTLNDEDTVPALAKKITKTLKVLATVADVSAGHVFWIDTNHFPITLIATSAAVTTASISIDKLKAIVPRGLLATLEDLSDHLCELYAQQLELAKRVTATVMNEKLAARMRKPEYPQRLPTIQPRAAEGVCSSARIYGDEVIPSSHIESRQLSDRNPSNPSLNADRDAPLHTKKTIASYYDQHQIERYDIPSQLPMANLAGSFLDKKHRYAVISEDQAVKQMPKEVPKQDEYCEPELTTRPIVLQQKESTTLLRLDVKVPVVGPCKDEFRISNRMKETPPIVTSVEWRRRSNKSDRGIAGLLSMDIEVEITSSDDGIETYALDVRARVHAQMSMIGPMRAMRLEPSRTPVNSLGKYFSDCPSPFARPGGSFQRHHMQLQGQPPKPTSHAQPPKDKPKKVLRANPKLLRAIGTPKTPVKPALIRKQGFLTSLRVSNTAPFDDDWRDFLDSVVPRIRQGRRFFYTLVDSVLREYADTISLNNIAQTPCLHSYDLCNPRQASMVNDVPVVPGEAEALLRQSFLLIVDLSTQFLLTASNAMEKQKWMVELTQASVLGGLQHSVSVTVQSPRPIVATESTDPTALAAVVINAFKGRRKSTVKERKRSSIFLPKPKPDDSLRVEYHIS